MLLKLNINSDGYNQLITIKQDRKGGCFDFGLLDNNAQIFTFNNLCTFEKLIDIWIMLFCYGHCLIAIDTSLEQKIKQILATWVDRIKEYDLEVQV